MGVKLAVEEINACRRRDGPQDRTARRGQRQSRTPPSTKAERLIERDKVVAIIGEISSASGLAIAQVASRTRSRSSTPAATPTSCAANRATATCSTSRARTRCTSTRSGQLLKRDGLVKGKKWYCLTADYAFGHDLLEVSPALRCRRTAATSQPNELVPTDTADFSAFILKIRERRSRISSYPISPAIRSPTSSSSTRSTACRTRSRAAASTPPPPGAQGRTPLPGSGPPSGITPSKAPSAKAFTAAFTKKLGQAAGESGLGRLCRHEGSRSRHRRRPSRRTVMPWSSIWNPAPSSTF